MKKLLLLMLLPLLLVGCGSDRTPDDVLPAFFLHVNDWLEDPTKENADRACEFLSEDALAGYPGGDSCQAGLRSAFGAWSGKEAYRVETTRPGRWIQSGGKRLRIQPVAIWLRQGRKRTVEQTDTAAILLRDDNWSIQSLSGLAFSIVLPERDLSPSPIDMALLAS